MITATTPPIRTPGACCPMQNVIGKAILIYWPPPDWAMIDHVDIAVAAP